MAAAERPARYTYVVLARVDSAPGKSFVGEQVGVDPEGPEEPALFAAYHAYGDFEGRTPDEAIEAAVEKYGLPNPTRTEIVAVPLRSFHERVVRHDPKPRYEIGVESLDAGEGADEQQALG